MTSKEWANYFSEFPDDPWKAEGPHGWDQLIADLAARERRAEAAEALVRRAVEFVEDCEHSHNTAFATRAAQWLMEVR
jgi:hypothetical protein